MQQQYPPGERQRIIYVLDLDTRLAPPRVRVRVLSARLLRDGSYGKTNRYISRPSPSMAKNRFVLQIDRDIMLRLKKLRQQRTGRLGDYLTGEEGAALLGEIVRTGRAHWGSKDAPSLRAGDPRPGRLTWELDADGVQTLTFATEPAAELLLPAAPPWYLDGRLCGPVEPDVPAPAAERVFSVPPLGPDRLDDVDAFLDRHAGALPIPEPRRLTIEVLRDVAPAPEISLFTLTPERSPRRAAASLPLESLRLAFRYDGVRVDPGERTDALTRFEAGRLIRVVRDRDAERRLLDRLAGAGMSPLDEVDPNLVPRGTTDLFGFFEDAEWIEFMLHRLPELEREGWRVDVADDFRFNFARQEGWYAELLPAGEGAASGDFELDLGVEVEGERVQLLPILVEMLQRLPRGAPLDALCDDNEAGVVMAPLGDGRRLPIPLERVRGILSVLVELYDRDAVDEAGRLTMHALQAGCLSGIEEAVEAPLDWRDDADLRGRNERLRRFDGIREVTPPEGFTASLRGYQREGLDWLQFLREYGLGGILADDMGLGKTVQTLAHLLVEKRAGRLDRPCLIVAPTSLLSNWAREAAHFAPDLSLLTLHGAERRHRFPDIPRHDVVLTTYPLLVRDLDELREHKFHYLILDEAQLVKNPKSKSSRAVRTLQARHRLCLTGTPMENHLGELWALFDFLMPGFLGSESSFRTLFRNPIEREGDEDRRRALAGRLAPFLLRRTKKGVERDLPPKTEMVRSAMLEGRQRRLYESIRLSLHEKVRAEVESRGLARSQLMILDALMKLRQVCCDPRLLDLEEARGIGQSAKFDMLFEMLPEMVEEGRRILLFSQFTSMLALIERELAARGIDYAKLTGKTRNRSRAIDRFQSGGVPLFLISLKAGGVGLNLTAADTVIHYDPWWNPAAEDQATDRAYRIGQEKPVFVYRLLTENTVEERIGRMQARKRRLAEGIYGKTADKGLSLTAEDIEQLFAPLG